jgi:putative hemolysin
MLINIRRDIAFPQLSYANSNHPRLKRWFIRSVEGLSGRDRFARLYDIWRREIVPTGEKIFGRMLDLVDISIRCKDQWPPHSVPDGPLVLVANHPFGIGDGVAVLSLAEQLGRPFRVMIHKDLLKIREMEPYSLPIDFSETKEALKNNLAMRHDALKLLKEGVTIVIFPAGGVSTAPKGFGKALDLPWKMFPAKLVREAKASVIPLYFSGQNGRLFHLVSTQMNRAEQDNRFARIIGKVSLTLRTSLLIREFARLSGKTISVRIGTPVLWQEMESLRDRKDLIGFLRYRVFSLESPQPVRRGGLLSPISVQRSPAAAFRALARDRVRRPASGQ